MRASFAPEASNLPAAKPQEKRMPNLQIEFATKGLRKNNLAF
jgi:hypothetical protein